MSTFAQIEARIVAAEQEIRALRGLLAAATRCRCPIGFGAQPDPNCPKHGSAPDSMLASLPGEE